jgi:ribosomal protein S27AE
MKALDTLSDVFKSIKRGKPEQIYCPKCGSPKLRLFSSLDYWLTPQRYFCGECGYMGSVFMELEKEEKEK